MPNPSTSMNVSPLVVCRSQLIMMRFVHISIHETKFGIFYTPTPAMKCCHWMKDHLKSESNVSHVTLTCIDIDKCDIDIDIDSHDSH
jgi:hypothetical protein